MPDTQFEQDVPAPGKELETSVAEVFGLKGRYGSPQLREDMEKIRAAERQADLIIASIQTD